jgi:tetratricopeptide (TPR) repeat protein
MCGLPQAGQQRVRAAAICCAAGKACAEAGELQKAARQMADGVEMLEQTVGKQDWFCVRSRILLGRIALDAGDPRAAKQAFQTTLEAGPQLLSDDSERSVLLDLLALAQGQLGEFAEGEQHMQASVALRERVLPLKHLDRVVMLTDYAWFCAMKEDWERSEAYAEQAIEKCRELRMPAEHPCTVCAYERQARALMAQSEFEKAEPVLRGVVAARQVTASSQGLCELLEMHAECLQQLKRTGEAERVRAKIEKLRQAEARSPASRG